MIEIKLSRRAKIITSVAVATTSIGLFTLNAPKREELLTPGDLARNTKEFVGSYIRVQAKIERVSQQPYSKNIDGVEQTLCDMKLVSVSPLEGASWHFTQVTHFGPPNSISLDANTADSRFFNCNLTKNPVEIRGRLIQLSSGDYTLVGMRLFDPTYN